MNSFLNTLISLSPVLLVVMPVAGACFGWGVSRMGLEFTRWTAFSNTLISCLILAALMFAPSLLRDNAEQPTRSISVSLKIPAVAHEETDKTHPLNIRWAIDTTTVWFLLLPTCLWPVLILLSAQFAAATRWHYFLLLILQALLAGVFVSYDLISFVTFLLLTTFCILCLIRIESGARTKQVFESTMYLQFLGDTFVMGGLLLTTVAYSWMQGLLLESPQALTFQFEKLLQGTVEDTLRYSLAATYWSSIAPWIFLLLLTGFIVKGTLFPLHYGLTQWLTCNSSPELSNQDSSGRQLLLLALITKICIYGMIRFLIPLSFDVGSSLYSMLSFWGMGGFLFSSLMVSLRKYLLPIVVWFLIGQTSLTLTVLFSAEHVLVSNFILLNVIQGLACCLLLVIVPLLDSHSGFCSAKFLRWIAGLAILTLMGIPGLGGFTAQFTFLWNLAHQSLLLGACYLIGTLLFNLALIRALWQLMKIDQHSRVSKDHHSMSLSTENMGLAWLSVSPAIILILVIGISPTTLVEKTQFPLKEVSVNTDENLIEEN